MHEVLPGELGSCLALALVLVPELEDDAASPVSSVDESTHVDVPGVGTIPSPEFWTNLSSEINEALEFEVDLAHAVSLVIRRVVAVMSRPEGAPAAAVLRDVAILAARQLVNRDGAAFDLVRACSELPALLRRKDVPVTLPAAAEVWIDRRGGSNAVAMPSPPGSPFDRPSFDFEVELRAFIATPLTKITQGEHDRLMPIARAVGQYLRATFGFRTEIPGAFLSPDVDSADDVTERYEREHQLISGADLVVVIGCENDSWGLSKTVAWAEMSLAPVLMLGRDTQPWCRVLSAGPYEVRHRVIDSVEELQVALSETVPQLLEYANIHARERVAVNAALELPLRRALREVERTIGDAPVAIPHDRLVAMLSHPTSFTTSSLSELRAAEAVLGHSTLSELIQLATSYGAQSRSNVTHLATQRTLGSLQFESLRSAALTERWTAEHVLSLLSDYFTIDVAPGRAAQKRFSAQDWVNQSRRRPGNDRW